MLFQISMFRARWMVIVIVDSWTVLHPGDRGVLISGSGDDGKGDCKRPHTSGAVAISLTAVAKIGTSGTSWLFSSHFTCRVLK